MVVKYQIHDPECREEHGIAERADDLLCRICVELEVLDNAKWSKRADTRERKRTAKRRIKECCPLTFGYPFTMRRRRRVHIVWGARTRDPAGVLQVITLPQISTLSSTRANESSAACGDAKCAARGAEREYEPGSPQKQPSISSFTLGSRETEEKNAETGVWQRFTYETQVLEVGEARKEVAKGRKEPTHGRKPAGRDGKLTCGNICAEHCATPNPVADWGVHTELLKHGKADGTQEREDGRLGTLEESGDIVIEIPGEASRAHRGVDDEQPHMQRMYALGDGAKLIVGLIAKTRASAFRFVDAECDAKRRKRRNDREVLSGSESLGEYGVKMFESLL
ncbi:hypothetical protein K488DRAFT_74521 [Vararia minispora EC-137]|uniref:Uncharacterized protein n=1 Tax=Vararia minispora EC-137 TaxID=1314806 RepID=A0ACB8Q6S9_9AGAM|nr:hypothetical protein K488DRAFT_74521 [Vararia minispora EC-137]